MNKNIYTVVAVLVLVLAAVYIATLFGPGEPIESNGGFIQCLADNGLVIYGSRTCPACTQLVESLGGYEAVAAIYVECTEEREKCNENMQTNYVPEIHLNGEVYEGSRAPRILGEITSCQL